MFRSRLFAWARPRIGRKRSCCSSADRSMRSARGLGIIVLRRFPAQEAEEASGRLFASDLQPCQEYRETGDPHPRPQSAAEAHDQCCGTARYPWPSLDGDQMASQAGTVWQRSARWAQPLPSALAWTINRYGTVGGRCRVERGIPLPGLGTRGGDRPLAAFRRGRSLRRVVAGNIGPACYSRSSGRSACPSRAEQLDAVLAQPR